MKKEIEIVEHAKLRDVKLFIVDLVHRSLHMHKEFELCLILSGSVELYVQKRTYLLQSGAFFLLNPKQPHEIKAREEGHALILSLQVSPRFCARYFPAIQQIEFDRIVLDSAGSDSAGSGRTDRSLQKHLLALARHYLKGERHFELSCYARLNDLFLILLETVSWHTLSESERSAKNNVSERINRIMDYIENHFTEKLLLSDIARQEGLSLTYLSHYFKDNLNLTFQEYLALLRFDAARNRIEHTDERITDISLACGFSDSRYLNRIFRRQLGCTPSEYRQRSRSGNTTADTFIRSATQRFLPPAESLQQLSMQASDPDS